MFFFLVCFFISNNSFSRIIINPLQFDCTAEQVVQSSSTPSIDLIESILLKNNPKSVNELLSYLPDDLRENYMLVYESGGLQSSSLQLPRVILTDKSTNFYLAFSGFEKGREADNEVEMIETYGKKKAVFAKVLFQTDENLKPKLIRDPVICKTCHAIDPKRSESGFIFDAYPHWPGVIGSSDNGEMEIEGADAGTGRIRTNEFEVNTLNDFKTLAPNHNRYKYLNHLNEKSIRSFQVINTNFAGYVGQFINKRIYSELENNKSLDEVVKINDFLISTMNPKLFSTDIKDELTLKFVSNYKSLEEEYNLLLKRFAEPLYEKTINEISSFGTLKDKENASIYKISYEGKLYSPKDPFLGVVTFGANQSLKQTNLAIKFLKNENLIPTSIFQSTLLSREELGTDFAGDPAQWFLEKSMTALSCRPVNTRSFEEWKECIPNLFWLSKESLDQYPQVKTLLDNIQKRWASNFFSIKYRSEGFSWINWIPTADQLNELESYPAFNREFIHKLRLGSFEKNKERGY